MPTQVPWLIFLLPFLSFLCIGLIVRPFFTKLPQAGRLYNHRRRRHLLRPFIVGAGRGHRCAGTYAADRRYPVAGSRQSQYPHRRPGGLADRRHAGSGNLCQPDGADILAGLYERRPRVPPLLCLHVAVHRLHARDWCWPTISSSCSSSGKGSGLVPTC